MDGGHDFCEVFYDEVRIPHTHVVGEVDDGWRVAMATLSLGRATAFMARQVRLPSTVERLIERASERPGARGRGSLLADVGAARRLAAATTENSALRALTCLGVSRAARTGTPGHAGSITKLYFAELEQKVARTAMDLLGRDGLRMVSCWNGGGWSGQWLTSFSASIGGGTSEIQRNIIGDRVLGLPR